MAKAVAFSAQDTKKIILDLEKIEKIRDRILRKIPVEMIPKSSNLRWIKEALEGKDDIKKGKSTKIRNDAELKVFFDNL